MTNILNTEVNYCTSVPVKCQGNTFLSKLLTMVISDTNMIVSYKFVDNNNIKIYNMKFASGLFSDPASYLLQLHDGTIINYDVILPLSKIIPMTTNFINYSTYDVDSIEYYVE